MSHKMCKNLLLFSVLILYFKEVMLDCLLHKSCHECIQDPSVCVWCPSNLYTDNERCKPASFGTSWCNGTLEIPINIKKTIENKDFSSKPLVQIKPQKYKLELRPGQPQDFSFSFQAVKNYPIDIYFLFDASSSMGVYRNRIATQAEDIYKTMKSMTNNVFMGMGTFVDKNALPYALKIKENLSYSFKHSLSLQNNFTEFERTVKNIMSGGNIDPQEGALDALAQAIACKNETGWRNESRKILILMTNANFHAAGEGKLAGIFKPYDGECYLKNGYYANELEMDYPSVGMINKLATDKRVTVIFVVESQKELPYKKLSKLVHGSKSFILNNRMDNSFANNLKTIYEEISTKIKLNVIVESPARRKDFLISFNPNCLIVNDSDTQCKLTGKKDEIKDFTGTITLLKYDNYDTAKININIDSFDDKLTLDIEVIKDCQCQKNNTEFNSEHCKKHGNRTCGICECDKPWFGDTCQCSPSARSKVTAGAECKTAGMTEPCNGYGTCSCGECISCVSGYVGPYCQCLSSNCPMHDGKACGRHGVCTCDRTCICDPNWSGPACECNIEHCKGPNGKVCNKRGECNCKKCLCEPIAEWDSRKEYDDFCGIKPCPECHNLQCKALTKCVQCLINKNKDCSCPGTQYKIVDKLPDNQNGSDWKVCSNFRVDVGCYTNFTYAYDKDEYRIFLVVEREKDCAMSYYLYGGIVLGTLLLVGILTLVGWKLMINYRDKQEFERFLKDHETDIAPCQNPLYEPAYTTFRNPAFRKMSVH